MSSTTNIFHLSALASALLLASMPRVYAQDAQPEKIHAEPEVIIVTGERIKRAWLSSTVGSTLLTGNKIDHATETDATELLNRVPNLKLNHNGFSIRGVQLMDTANGITPALGAVIVDGVSQPLYAVADPNFGLWDVDRVEILRGPQSTNLGRNSLAGAMIITTRTPEAAPEAAVRLRFGSEHRRQLAVVAGGALGSEHLTGRIAFDARDGDGSITNVTRNEKDWNKFSGRNLRARLKFTHGEADAYTALFTYARNRRDKGDLLVDQGEDVKNRIARSDERWRHKAATDIYALEQNYRLSPAFSLSAISSYTKVKSADFGDFDRTAEPQGIELADISDPDTAHEFKLNFNAANWQAVAGVHLSHGRTVVDGYGHIPLSYVQTTLGICNGVPACLEQFRTGFIDYGFYYRKKAQNQALFIEADYKLADALSLVLGVRQDAERITFQNRQTVTGEGAVATNLVSTLRAGGYMPSDKDVTGDTRFSALLPKIGLVWKFQPDWSLGITAQRAYRAGGVSFNLNALQAPMYEPEYTDNLELAVRGKLGDRARLSLNTFYVKWRKQQMRTGLGSDYTISNAGQSRFYGAELELTVKPDTQWEWMASMGYVNTRYQRFISPTGDFSGNQFPNAPKLTFGTELTYRPSGVTYLSLEGNYQSQSFSTPQNTADSLTPARMLVNLRMGWNIKTIKLYAYTTNLFNRQYVLENRLNFANYTTYLSALGERRAVGVGIDYRF